MTHIHVDSKLQEVRIVNTLTGLTMPYCCASPKPETEF